MKWNNYLKISMAFIFATFISCSKNDNPVKIIPPDVNTPPEAPAVSVLEVKYNRATISWDEASDADDDTLYYSLFLDDSLVVANITTAYLYNFENLRPATSYQGSVVVTDSVNNPVLVAFNFTTPEYITTFSKVYHNNLCSTSGGTSIELTSDKGYIIAGQINCETHYTYLLKIDSLGYEQWNKIFDITGSTLRYRVIDAMNGDFVLVSNKSILRTDPTGNVLWQFDDVGDYLQYFDLVETSEQELIVVGISTGGQAIMTKIGEEGEVFWKRTIGDKSFIFQLSVSKTGDSNFALLGSIQQDVISSFGLIKTNSEGGILWEKIFETPDSDITTDILLTMDNGFLLTGTTLKYRNEATIIKTNADGELEWKNTITNPGLSTFAYGVTQTKQGDYVLCGSAENYNEQTFLRKIDEDGNLLWEVIYKPEESMDYVWIPHDIKLTADGGFVITGAKSFVWYGDEKDSGIWVLKTDSRGGL